MNVKNFHCAVHCLAHVINRQKRHIHAHQCLHLHSGLPGNFDRAQCLYNVFRFLYLKINGTFIQAERMTHRDQI